MALPMEFTESGRGVLTRWYLGSALYRSAQSAFCQSSETVPLYISSRAPSLKLWKPKSCSGIFGTLPPAPVVQTVAFKQSVITLPHRLQDFLHCLVRLQIRRRRQLMGGASQMLTDVARLQSGHANFVSRPFCSESLRRCRPASGLVEPPRHMRTEDTAQSPWTRPSSWALG